MKFGGQKAIIEFASTQLVSRLQHQLRHIVKDQMWPERNFLRSPINIAHECILPRSSRG
jgi:hypothetical protein